VERNPSQQTWGEVAIAVKSWFLVMEGKARFYFKTWWWLHDIWPDWLMICAVPCNFNQADNPRILEIHDNRSSLA
jgi:hypothetical protein